MTAKKRGRPSTAPKKGERNSLGFRVTADLKKKLMQSAEVSGRSISQEAEYRLDKSFGDQDLFGSIAGSAANGAILVSIGQMMRAIGDHSKADPILLDPQAFAEFREAMVAFFAFWMVTPIADKARSLDGPLGRIAGAVGAEFLATQPGKIRDALIEMEFDFDKDIRSDLEAEIWAVARKDPSQPKSRKKK